MVKIAKLKRELKKLADPNRARLLQRYFKTGKGEYGEGDIFLGLTVPQSRSIAVKYTVMSLSDVGKLIQSKYHEERLIALLILVSSFAKASADKKKEIFNFYLVNTKYINNWDLVDLSSHEIVGGYLLNKENDFARQPRVLDNASSSGSTRSLDDSSKPSGNTRFRGPAVSFPSSDVAPKVLISLAKSKNIWERRIAVISTFEFIRNNRFDESLKLAEMLVGDKHDLMHKAVGWMLREIGKKDLKAELKFLDKHCKSMPRAMLRYSIEKFPEKLRKHYLGK